MTYWHYTYMKSGKINGGIEFGWAIRTSCTEFPDFVGIHESRPDVVILSVNEISAEQYEALYKHMTKLKEDGDKR